jgi:hypothetical protein
MRRLFLLGLACAVALAASSGSATAFEGGGRSPSAAPTVEWGQHYLGQLNNHRDDANFTSSPATVALYRLPPVSTRDVVAVNWHALPFTGGSSGYPVTLMLLQGVDDFNWGTTFYDILGSCCSGTGIYRLSGSGTARSEITVQQTDSSATYLAFYSSAYETDAAELETYPYDFTVEAPRHALTLSVPSVNTVATYGQLRASVAGVTGGPAPDGQTYTLTASWSGGVWTGTSTSGGGNMTFQLSLPEAAQEKSVKFVVSRPADSQFQGVESTGFYAKVTAPYVPPVPKTPKLKPNKACKKATTKVDTLARQRHRLQRNLHRARVRRVKRQLRHKVGQVTQDWQAAQAAADAACP